MLHELCAEWAHSNTMKARSSVHCTDTDRCALGFPQVGSMTVYHERCSRAFDPKGRAFRQQSESIREAKSNRGVAEYRLLRGETSERASHILSHFDRRCHARAVYYPGRSKISRVNANSLRENFSNEPHTAQLAGGWLFEKSDFQANLCAVRKCSTILFLSFFAFLFVIPAFAFTFYGSDDVQYLLTTGNGIYATAINGVVYRVSADSSKYIWSAQLANISARPIVVGNYLVVGDRSGYVTFLSRDTGAVVRQLRFIGSISSMAVGDDNSMFVSANRSVSLIRLAPSISVNWTSSVGISNIKKLSYGDKLLALSEDMLFILSPATGAISSSYPVRHLRDAIQAGTDIYAYNELDEFHIQNKSQNSLSPAIKLFGLNSLRASSDYLYLTSTAGKVYVYSLQGRRIVATNEEKQGLDGAILLEKGFLVMGNRGTVYGYSSLGVKEFEFNLGGHMTDWALFGNSLIYAIGNRVLSTRLDNLCGIDSPSDNDLVPFGYLDISGSAYSGTALRQVQAYAGNLMVIADGQKRWRATVDISGLPDGEIDVSCLAVSSASEGDLHTVLIYKSPEAPLKNMVASYPPDVPSTGNALIRAFDEAGRPLRNVTLIVDDKAYKFSENISVLVGVGSKTLLLTRPGYKDYPLLVRGYGIDNTGLMIIGFSLVLIGAGIYVAFLRK